MRVKFWQHLNTLDLLRTFRPSPNLLDFYAQIVWYRRCLALLQGTEKSSF